MPGERLPDDVLEAAQAVLADIMIAPGDVADAVMYAVTRPPHVHIPEIVIRPNTNFDLETTGTRRHAEILAAPSYC